MRNFAKVLLLELVAIAALASFVAVPLSLSSASPAPTVAYVGDSTMVGEVPYLPPGATVLAFPGITVPAAYSAWGAELTALNPQVVVVSLGLNGSDDGLGFLFQVDAFVHLFSPATKVVWLQPTVEPAWCSMSRWNFVNSKAGVIDAVSSINPNMTVLAWNPDDSWYVDGVHYTAQGYQTRASLIAAEVAKAGA